MSLSASAVFFDSGFGQRNFLTLTVLASKARREAVEMADGGGVGGERVGRILLVISYYKIKYYHNLLIFPFRC